MKKFLISAAALMAGTAALAQTAPIAPAPSTPPAPMVRPMADKVMTRAEMAAMVQQHFTQLDANKDGVVTTAEATAGKENWTAHRHAMGGTPGDPNTAFDRVDTNKDGTISRDEFAKAHEQRIEKRVEIRKQRQEVAKGGKSADKQAWRMQHGMGGMGGRMIVMADTNKDGKITLAEAQAMALQHFDKMDANHDGQVTPQERRAARPMMRKQMQTQAPGQG